MNPEKPLSSNQEAIEFAEWVKPGKLPVLVEFYSDNCTFWHILDPEMEQIKELFADRVRIMKINADTHDELAAGHEVEKYPTLILFREGNPVWRHTGLIMITQLMNVLESHLGIEP